MVLYITLSKGTMFGGKSSELEKRYRQYIAINKYAEAQGKQKMRILVTKPYIDTRDSNLHIVTHDGKKIPCIQMKNLMDINIDDYDVIIIDEAQWFPDLYQFVEKNFHKNARIHIAGLNGDKHQRNFGNGDINLISPFCSEETKHNGMCHFCGDPAPFTKYKGMSQELNIPGGDDEYYTVCAKHLDTPVEKKWGGILRDITSILL